MYNILTFIHKPSKNLPVCQAFNPKLRMSLQFTTLPLLQELAPGNL